MAVLQNEVRMKYPLRDATSVTGTMEYALLPMQSMREKQGLI